MFFLYLPNCGILSARTAPFQELRPSANGRYSYLNVCSSGALNNSPATILFRSIDACNARLILAHVTDSCCFCSPGALALLYFFAHKTVFRGFPRLHTPILVCYFARSYKLLWLCALPKCLTIYCGMLFRDRARFTIIAQTLSYGRKSST